MFYLGIADTACLTKRPLHDSHTARNIIAGTVTLNHLTL